MQQVPLVGSQNINANRELALGLLSEKINEVYSQVPDEIKGMDELTLLEHFRATPSDYFLRRRLWDLVPTGVPIDVTVLCGTECTKQNFYASILTNHYRFVWILTPWKMHSIRIEEAYEAMFAKIRNYIATVKINDDNVGAVVKLYNMLADRHLGPVVKNVNVRAHVHNTSDVPQNPLQLEEELKRLKQAGPVIDVKAD